MLTAFLLALLTSPAAAHGGGTLSGAWSVASVTAGDKTQTFPDVLLGGEKDVVYGRWLWVFGTNSLTVATQLGVRGHDDVDGSAEKASRDAAYLWCQAQVTVPMSQDNGHLTLPNRIQTSGRAGRFSGDNAVVSSDCAVQLTGVAKLELVANAKAAPKNAVTLQNEAKSLTIVLVPDGSPATLDRTVPKLETLLGKS